MSYCISYCSIVLQRGRQQSTRNTHRYAHSIHGQHTTGHLPNFDLQATLVDVVLFIRTWHLYRDFQDGGRIVCGRRSRSGRRRRAIDEVARMDTYSAPLGFEGRCPRSLQVAMFVRVRRQAFVQVRVHSARLRLALRTAEVPFFRDILRSGDDAPHFFINESHLLGPSRGTGLRLCPLHPQGCREADK